jgi:hypothetical protein
MRVDAVWWLGFAASWAQAMEKTPAPDENFRNLYPSPAMPDPNGPALWDGEWHTTELFLPSADGVEGLTR